MLSLVLVVAVLLLVALVSLRSNSYWTRRGIPQLPGAWFLFGHFKEAVSRQQSFGEICTRLYRKASPADKLVGLYLFLKPAVMISDPELIKAVLVKDFSSFHDRGIIVVNEEVDPLSGHLFFLPGEKWRILRNKLSPTFTSGKMKFMFPVLAACGKEMADVLSREPQELEFRDLLARFGTDVIASCAFGIEGRSLKDPSDEFRQWGRRLFQTTALENLKGFVSQLFPRFAAALKIKITPQEIEDYFMDLVKTTMDYRDTHNISRGDFLQLLMQLREDESSDDQEKSRNGCKKELRLSLGELTAQVFVFFLAGFETSSTTMSYALNELAWNQDVQKRLQQEIDETLEKTGGELTYDAMMDMPYLDKVISETLRKHPAVPTLNREVTQTYQVPGTEWTLEKGTAIIIPVMGLHMDPQHYPEPDTFDPERFDNHNKAQRHPYVYLPFGEGPRNCIGMRFGLMQTKVGLASLLSRYSFQPCARTVRDIPLDPKTFTASPLTGIWLRHESRRKQQLSSWLAASTKDVRHTTGSE